MEKTILNDFTLKDPASASLNFYNRTILQSYTTEDIGTCSNGTDDYRGASFCNSGWANRRSHRFNLNTADQYEGRIIQYWVK